MIQNGSFDSARILIVDDEEPNRRLFSDLVKSIGHQAVAVADGESALNEVSTDPPDLILLDIMMPVMTGMEVLERIRHDDAYRHIPVLVVTGLSEMECAAECIRKGADDYLVKPINFLLLKARIASSLQKKQLHDQEVRHRVQIEEYNQMLEARVQEQVREISMGQMAIIFAMSKLAESRDPETGEHLDRMSEYVRLLALQIRKHSKYAPQLSDKLIENICMATPLHDIGKVGVPDRILQKPGKLTPDEFDVMKRHPVIGADTLRAVLRKHPKNALVMVGIEIAQSHHERWDGKGYPDAVAGEQIPLPSRIVALADVYDALTSKRCYKDACSHEESVEIILQGRASQFDPTVVDAFVEVEGTFVTIRQTVQDSEKQMLC